MTSTEFHTAEEKEKVLEQFKRFLSVGCPKHLFTKLLYDYASNMYGHIANYNRDGYWETWFAGSEEIVRWMRRAMEHAVCGDPAFTRSDVERALSEWLRSGGLLAGYEHCVAEEVEMAERAELARLQAKYGVVG